MFIGLAKLLSGHGKQLFRHCLCSGVCNAEQDNYFAEASPQPQDYQEHNADVFDYVPEESSADVQVESQRGFQEQKFEEGSSEQAPPDVAFAPEAPAAPAATEPLPLMVERVRREESYRNLMRSFSSLHDSIHESSLVAVAPPAEVSPTDAKVSGVRPARSAQSLAPTAFVGRSSPLPVGAEASRASSRRTSSHHLPSNLPARSAVLDALVALDSGAAFEGLTTADLTLDVTVGNNALLWSGTGRSGPLPTSSGTRGQQPQTSSLQQQQQQQQGGAAAWTSSSSANAASVSNGPASTLTEPPLNQLPLAGDVPASARAINLSQVRELVTELRVLHIRPGAALLIGTATDSGQQVVARFERGRPDMLLAPQLLSVLGSCHRALAHANVVSTLGVHTIVLPAHVLDAPAAASPALTVQLPSSLRPSTERFTGQGTANINLGPGPSGVSGSPDSESAIPWLFDKDLATATLALQQAEAVRGASHGSAFIGNTMPSSGTVTGRVRLMRALGGPQVRLRDVVGHLRSRGAIERSVGGWTFGDPARVGPPIRGSAGGQAVHIAAGDVSEGAMMGLESFAFVTLSITELCEGGNLFDEARRGSFKCCLHPDAVRAAQRGLYAESDTVSYGSSSSGPPPPSAALLAQAVFANTNLVRRLERFVATAREVAQGLRHLHTACGLAHGDLVSRNVLLQRRPLSDAHNARGYVAKVAGYGRLVSAPALYDAQDCEGGPEVLGSGSAHSFTPLAATSLTRVNTVHVGLWRDVHSLAPERLLEPHAPPSFEADIYALGTVLYEMAVAEVPWVGMTPACVAVGTATGDLRITCSQPCALPSIGILIERCTAQLPADRPSLDDVLAALECIAEEVAAGRDLQAARQQQRDGELLVHSFLDSGSTW